MTTEGNLENQKQNEVESNVEERLSTTNHSIQIGDSVIEYTATAGTIVIKEEPEKQDGNKEKPKNVIPKASIFFVAYTRNKPENVSEAQYRQNRPVTFAFNGGPGSSSVWLHLGLLGPRRVLLDDDGYPYPPPYRLVDNVFSLLDVTDLVFIDPVSTGYSRPVPGEKAEQFHTFQKDIESVGEFIRLYTTRYQRWTSPKFLIGESYGTTRAAGLTGYLQERLGMYLNGVMLVSSILNFQTARFVPGNDLPFILFLPTYTATAWYHKRLSPDLQKNLGETLQQVEDFAMQDYTLALMKGDALGDDERMRIAEKLAFFTGLSVEYILNTNLRINIYRFVKELLRGEGKTVGRLDSRYTGIDRDSAGEHFEFDPSYAAVQGPYTATFNDYVRSELKFESDLLYEILTDRVHPWRFDEHQNQYVNVAETLRKAIHINPNLKVFVANGYYDLATPFLATRYTFNHMELKPTLQKNIRMSYYEAGHMMYVHKPSLEKLKHDLTHFVEESIAKDVP